MKNYYNYWSNHFLKIFYFILKYEIIYILKLFMIINNKAANSLFYGFAVLLFSPVRWWLSSVVHFQLLTYRKEPNTYVIWLYHCWLFWRKYHIQFRRSSLCSLYWFSFASWLFSFTSFLWRLKKILSTLIPIFSLVRSLNLSWYISARTISRFFATAIPNRSTESSRIFALCSTVYRFLLPRFFSSAQTASFIIPNWCVIFSSNLCDPVQEFRKPDQRVHGRYGTQRDQFSAIH